jgi:catechol 2,3-dioxygenase-like lactoylglutathione lyase family enzyme
MTIKHLDHLNLTVANLQETIDWYGAIFGFEVVERGMRDENTPWAVLKSGESMLCVYQHADREGPERFGRDEQRRHVIYHFGFRITDRDAWLATVQQHGLELEYGGNVEYAHSTSWYVSDPTGYSIEVALWDDDTIRFDSARPTERAGTKIGRSAHP